VKNGSVKFILLLDAGFCFATIGARGGGRYFIPRKYCVRNKDLGERNRDFIKVYSVLILITNNQNESL